MNRHQLASNEASASEPFREASVLGHEMMPYVCAVCGERVVTVYRHEDEREEHEVVAVHSLPAYALCVCGHSESSHSSRAAARARGMDVGLNGGAYRCQQCACESWQEVA